MSALLDVCGNDTGSPSISKAEDNLSNSDGPLIKGLIRQNSCGSVHARTIGSSYGMSSSSEKSTKRRYCLWTLTLILAIIGLCNLFLNITVIAVLRISQGMEAMEVIPDENLVKFYGRTDLDKISLQSGVCQSYGDEPMEVSGDEAGVHVDIKGRGRSIQETHPRSKLSVLVNGTTMSQVESFEVKDPRTGVTYFTTDFPNFGLPSGVETIDVRIAETYRITSPVNESLAIKSDNQISMHGAEGVRMESKDIVWSADLDVFLKSVNGNVMLDAEDSVSIDVESIPVAPMFLPSPAGSHEQYKVCVCMLQGKLFKIRVMSEPSHVPPLWSTAYVAGLTGGLLGLSKDQNQDAKQNSTPLWQVSFPQPASDYLAFRRKLDQDNVSLENVIVRESEQCLVGTVKVRNLAYDKEVVMRVSNDSWSTHEDVYCTYVEQRVSPATLILYDTFRFRLTLPVASNLVEFCVRYRTDGNESWDNNEGKNYVIRKKQEPRLPAKWSDNIQSCDGISGNSGSGSVMWKSPGSACAPGANSRPGST